MRASTRSRMVSLAMPSVSSAAKELRREILSKASCRAPVNSGEGIRVFPEAVGCRFLLPSNHGHDPVRVMRLNPLVPVVARPADRRPQASGREQVPVARVLGDELFDIPARRHDGKPAVA